MIYETYRAIVNSNQTKIYEVRYGESKTPACLKVLYASNTEKANKYITEIINLSRVSTHNLSLKLIDWRISDHKEKKKIEIITEYCSRGNLEIYLLSKSAKNQYYTYQEIVKIYKDFIEYFALLQQNGISHRDIKAQNIFITEDGDFRVGDFGSSKIIIGNKENHTISGTESYLSPELREGYHEYLNRRGGLQIKYSPFKSDVYSLGLVFFFIYTLNIIDSDFDIHDMQKLDDFLNMRLNEIGHYPIRMLLKKMLELNPDNRPDFIELSNIIDEYIVNVHCTVCFKNLDISFITCWKCNLPIHVVCFKGKKNCPCCQSSLVQCEKCGDTINVPKTCNHYTCSMCSYDKIECLRCTGFRCLQTDNGDMRNIEQKMFCCRCFGKLMAYGENALKCENCREKFCVVCKGKLHSGLCCVMVESVEKIVCVCKTLCERRTDDIFYMCNKCGYRCYVCMGSIEKSHVGCVQLIDE